MEPIANAVDAAKTYVVSSTLSPVDWNAELVRGDLGEAVEQLKRASGKGLFVGGVKLPPALAELGLTMVVKYGPLSPHSARKVTCSRQARSVPRQLTIPCA